MQDHKGDVMGMPLNEAQHRDTSGRGTDSANAESGCVGARSRLEAPGAPRAASHVSKCRIAGLAPRELAKRAACIMLGSAILTFGVHNIHDVTGITEGGIIGLVLFGDHWLNVPPSVVSPVLDGLSYLVALKVLGGGFLGWSAIATVAVAGFYRLWESLPYLLPNLSDHPLVAAVLGAMFVGIGVGIVIRQGASAGGDDALALSISKVTHWRVGRCYLFTDLTVLALSLSYIPVAKIIYSLITVSISSLLIDVVKDASWDRVQELGEWVRQRRFARRGFKGTDG